MFTSVWLKTTKPPGVTWPFCVAVNARLRTVLTTSASCRRSVAPEVGEITRKYRSLVPGAWPAGMVTSTCIVLFAPEISTPVEVITASEVSRKTTLQPVGNVVVEKPEFVLEERL